MMNQADWPLYHYRGEVLRVVDGDTIWVRFDSGRRQYSDESVRIVGYDAPELFSGTNREAGQAAKDALEDILGGVFAEGSRIYLRTHKDHQSFNRYIAEVFVAAEDGTLVDVAESMLATGLVVPYP